MPWTETTLRDYRRDNARYASGLTDREWDLIVAFMPALHRIGRPRSTDLRDVLDAVLYMATTSCQWRILPRDFPPASTAQRYFYEWHDSGLWHMIRFHLAMATLELKGRAAQGCIHLLRLPFTPCAALDHAGLPADHLCATL